MATFITAEEAALLIPSGATLAISGDGEMVMPDAVLAALENRFLTQQEPIDLTTIFPIILGARAGGRGADRLSHPGLVKRVIGSSLYTLNVRRINQRLMDNELEGYHLPMSIVFNMLRAAAAGQPGFLTEVGLGSFVDPRVEAGRANQRSSLKLMEVMEIDGREYLYFRALPVGVSIIRGTSADEYGNVSLENEAITSGVLTIAMAAKSSGGITIAQVKRVVQGGSLHPKRVVVPAPLVDYVVVDPHQQEEVEFYNPAFTGDVRAPLSEIERLEMGATKIIVRRAALELHKGKLYNLGFGIPASLPLLLAEEGLIGDVFLNVEHGPVGGIPYGKLQFGASTNPLAIMDTVQVLDMYDGGCLDGTFLGMAELDKHGNVNVSRLNGFLNIGGFMNIVHRTPRIVFCGTLTSGGLNVELESGRIAIRHEGQHRKLVNGVNQVSFDAARALRLGQHVTYITERAVFELAEDGPVLTEIAPGVDLRRDILSQMDFEPRIATPLKQIDSRCFQAESMSLRLPS